jgi:hypothetical protein
MALRDWIYRFEEPAAAVPAVIAVQEPKNERKTAKTATTATAKDRKSAVDLATPDGPRTVTVTGNATPTGNRINDAAIYQGQPTREAVDVADRLLTHLANLDRPATEAEILTAVGGDEVYCRNILYRLAVDGIVEALPSGLFGIPEYPPKPANLPEGCPLLGPGPHPAGCRFEAKLLRRMMTEGALPLPSGRCPLRTTCKVGRENGVKC